MIKSQKEFPLLDEYKKFFHIDDNTIFALGEDIYTNHDLSPSILVHENTHLKQQAEVGLKEWVYDFLYCPDKRLEYEVEAYREEIKSIKDRNLRAKVRFDSAKKLSSELYGNMVEFQDAYDLLKI